MAETINMPKLGFDMAEGTLVRWLKKEGETVAKGDVLAEIETDKATVEVESSASGVVRRLLVDEGAVVPVNTPIAIIGAAEEQLPVVSEQSSVSSGQSSVSSDQLSVVERSGEPEKQKSEPVAQSTISNPQSTILRASPLAKKIARERNLDLSRVRGTGPGGRIVRRDVEAVIGQQKVESKEQSVESRGAEESVPLTKLRQIIARRMAEAKASVPHFYVTHEFKMDSLLALRTQLNGYLPEEEKISVNDFIVRAAALTLRQFPNLNASFAGDKVVRHAAINIGVAVAVEGGLLTVVCKDADQKPLRQIAAEVKRMAAAARRQGQAGGHRRLDVFDFQPGDVRCGELCRHHQPTRGGYSGCRFGAAGACCGGRRGQSRLADEGHALGGSPRQRRGRSGSIHAGIGCVLRGSVETVGVTQNETQGMGVISPSFLSSCFVVVFLLFGKDVIANCHQRNPLAGGKTAWLCSQGQIWRVFANRVLFAFLSAPTGKIESMLPGRRGGRNRERAGRECPEWR
jgi:pyruvate dehydrogenase E2 component (dihydrolipoamide acetyltransferase)